MEIEDISKKAEDMDLQAQVINQRINKIYRDIAQIDAQLRRIDPKVILQPLPDFSEDRQETRSFIYQEPKQIEISFKFDFSSLNNEFVQRVINGIAALVDISSEEIIVRYTDPGSILLTLVMPKNAADRLIALYRNKSSVIEFLNIEYIKHVIEVEQSDIRSFQLDVEREIAKMIEDEEEETKTLKELLSSEIKDVNRPSKVESVSIWNRARNALRKSGFFQIPTYRTSSSWRYVQRKQLIEFSKRQARQLIERRDIQRYVCPLLTGASNNSYEIARITTPVLVRRVVAGDLPIPLMPTFFAAIVTRIARMGVPNLCNDIGHRTEESKPVDPLTSTPSYTESIIAPEARQKERRQTTTTTSETSLSASLTHEQEQKAQQIYRNLLKKALGNRELVDRLIAYERVRRPDANYLELLQRVNERWERDHQ